MTKKLLVPDIGEFENVEVIELLVKEGQEIKKNDPIVTIESDKSSVEIPSTIEGKIEKIEVKVGDKVSKDDLLLTISGEQDNFSVSQEVPKNTENLIKEAENSLKNSQQEVSEIAVNKTIENKQRIEKTREKKFETIQVVNEGDIDPLETSEWLDSLSSVIEKDGNKRAHYLIKELINKAYMEGANIPYTQNTPYINTIPVSDEKKSNGDQNIERRIRSLIRWNAAAMVVRANKKFPWRSSKKDFALWTEGKTGIPLVDAAMSQIYEEGWMHNRLRMVVGSFLVKNLLLNWTLGERYFQKSLLDYDEASNAAGWQWIAGCGADASPYFRVFNPVLQSEKFDPQAQFILKYIPQLKIFNSSKTVFEPYLDKKLLDSLVKEKKYVNPIVDLKESRNRALDAYQQTKS